MTHTAKIKTKDGFIELKGPFSAKDIRALSKYNQIEKLSLTKQSLITTKIANGFSHLKSVNWLWPMV